MKNKKVIFILLIISFIISCSPKIPLEGSYWIFGDGLGAKRYYENRWDCFYKESNSQFYVECFLEDGSKMDSFYTNKVQYVEE